MSKPVMYRTIVAALAVGLGCVPGATDALASGPDGSGIVLIHGGGGGGGGGGHGGGGGGHGGFGGGGFDGGGGHGGFGGGGFHDHGFVGQGGGHWGHRGYGDPYWGGYDYYNSMYDYDQCWVPQRVRTRTGWHWHEVWACL